LPAAIRMPRTWDPERLAHELAAVERFERRPAVGPYHDGEWRGLGLQTMGGEPMVRSSFPGLNAYVPTAAFAHTPYFAEIYEELPCPKQMVRLMHLPPGGQIRRHIDIDTTFQFGLVRLHIPIETSPDVHFEIDGELCRWKPGEMWYGDFRALHSVRNDGTRRRVHLIFDCELTDELLAWFPADFVAAQAKLGISKAQAPLALPVEQLRRFECRYRIPGDIVPLLVFGPLREALRGLEASLRLVEDRLVTHIDGEPVFAHMPLANDELGFVGFPSGARLRFRFAGDRVAALELVLRGLPRNLAAARVGIPVGPPIPERSVPLTLS
jgi:hypothetical protein